MDRDNPHDIYPHDGASRSFDVVIRGYDRSQVHDMVDRLDGELRVALADKVASAERAAELASHLASVQGEVESLRQKAQSAAAPNFESMGARISHMLKLAEEEANDIRRMATEDRSRRQAELESSAQEASRLRAEAQDEARHVTEQAQAEATRLTEQAQDVAAKTVAEAQSQADELNERANASAEKSELASKARVAKIEEDFQLAQKARRAEAARVEQERDQSSRRDAQNRTEQAQRKSDDMVAAAEQRVAELDAQRGELHGRLSKVREILRGLPEIGTATVIEPSAEQTPSKPSDSNSNSKVQAGAPTDGDTTEPEADTTEPEADTTEPEADTTESIEVHATDQTEPAVDLPTDVQGPPPPPAAPAAPAPPNWPVNSPAPAAPTQAIRIPRQG